jgi:hypothetical protein
MNPPPKLALLLAAAAQLAPDSILWSELKKAFLFCLNIVAISAVMASLPIVPPESKNFRQRFPFFLSRYCLPAFIFQEAVWWICFRQMTP